MCEREREITLDRPSETDLMPAHKKTTYHTSLSFSLSLFGLVVVVVDSFLSVKTRPRQKERKKREKKEQQQCNNNKTEMRQT